ncbi:MAG TPA: YCF48-related protein [Candidatus Dormibacteraeota bacterium]
MQFVSETQGWAVAGGHLYWTADGGCHWRNITPEDGPQWGANAIFFLDRVHGWVATGQEVFRTTDGGRSWKKTSVAFSGDLVGLDFVDANNGWLATAGFGGGEMRPAEPAGDIFHTTDGGLHWTDQVDNRLNGGQMRFLTSAIGWALNYAEDKLYRSDDGGVSWTAIEVAPPPGYEARLSLPTFSTPSDGVLAATLLRRRNGSAPPVRYGGDVGLTYMVSHDGGLSWTPTRVFIEPPLVIPVVVSGKTWMVAHPGTTDTDMIETTVDAGQTWTQIRPVGLPLISQFDFASPLVGWARPSGYECVAVGQTCSYREDLLVTVDGGKRWTTIDLTAAGL